MVSDLKLKGNELLVYAVIFGFCQESSQCFYGSLQYIADWISSSKHTVINCLKSLQDKGLIGKHEYYQNRVKFCAYYVKNFNGGSENFSPPIENFSPNILIDKLKDSSSSRKAPTLEEVKAYAQTRNRVDLAEKFWDYFNATGWIDSNGKKVKNWKAKFLTWESHTEKPKEQQRIWWSE